jgi:hypothetical protein
MLKLRHYTTTEDRTNETNEAEQSRRARIILALAEEQAAGKLLEALINHHRLLLRLYQTLANIIQKKLYHTFFPFPEEVLLEARKQNKTKKRKKDNTEP